MSVLAVDVGGTFTDVVSWDGATINASKIPTSQDPAVAMAVGVGPQDRRLLHGTTVATNALLQRTGARTALVADAGFEDVVEIGRQDRSSLYDSDADRSQPIVARDARFADSELEAVIRMQPEAVAVSLLGAHLDGAPERMIADRLRRSLGGVAVALSSEVSPEMREFERTSTTVINAYLQPTVSGYLRHLSKLLPHGTAISVMRSSGGMMSVERAAQLPAAVLLSGPAGGSVATAALAAAMGRSQVISFDMGGTSTDVSRIEGGRPETSYERSIAGLACRLPSVAIHTVGAGGGSIAWRDAGGALRVGPRSSGADPGPASYGRGGTEPTVTDANLALGRLRESLGGHLSLNHGAATAALQRLDLGTVLDAAAGVITIVEENMANAIREVSIEEGVDPADATLVAFGGAGGLHATSLARNLGMASVIVPLLPGVFSALGLLLSPSRAEGTVALDPDADAMAVAAAVAAAERGASSELQAMTGSPPTAVDTFLDMRYRGQSHELTVPWDRDEGWEAAASRFHDLHAARNGFSRPADPVEVITARAEATGPATMDFSDIEWEPDGDEPQRGDVEIIESGVPVQAGLWWRPSVTDHIAGPAIIAEPSATTLLGSGERASLHPNGALEIEW
jgi:N-methylhydantoinase A